VVSYNFDLEFDLEFVEVFYISKTKTHTQKTKTTKNTNKRGTLRKARKTKKTRRQPARERERERERERDCCVQCVTTQRLGDKKPRGKESSLIVICNRHYTVEPRERKLLSSCF
jgi:hypothetical protein